MMTSHSRRKFLNSATIGSLAAAGSLYVAQEAQATCGSSAAGVIVCPSGSDDTATIQNALNSSRDVYLSPGNYTITNSLYMKTDFQELRGQATISMSAALGKPCIYIGAVNSNGTPTSQPISGAKVSGLLFYGSGIKTAGSCGIAFVRATTTRLDSIAVFHFYAGIQILNVSLANTIINPNLQYNVVGLYDPSIDPSISDMQCSQILGGRIEANENEGVIVGSPNVKFFGTVIEGNGLVNGTMPEARIISGSIGGAIHFIDCYMESFSSKTATSMIKIGTDDAYASGIHRRLYINGGEYYAMGTDSRYIVESNSNSTSQGIYISGGQFSNFKNYVKTRTTLQNNSAVIITNVWADNSRDASVDAQASLGAMLYQLDRATGLRSNTPARFSQVFETSTTDAGSQFNGSKSSFKISLTSVSSTAQIVPATRVSSGAAYIAEITAVGRGSASAGMGFKANLIIAAGNGSGSLLSSVVEWITLGALSSLSFSADSSGNISVSGLNTYYVFDFYITLFAKT